jgi:hypothetical protein
MSGVHGNPMAYHGWRPGLLTSTNDGVFQFLETHSLLSIARNLRTQNGESFSVLWYSFPSSTTLISFSGIRGGTDVGHQDKAARKERPL